MNIFDHNQIIFNKYSLTTIELGVKFRFNDGLLNCKIIIVYTKHITARLATKSYYVLVTFSSYYRIFMR